MKAIVRTDEDNMNGLEKRIRGLEEKLDRVDRDAWSGIWAQDH